MFGFVTKILDFMFGFVRSFVLLHKTKRFV